MSDSEIEYLSEVVPAPSQKEDKKTGGRGQNKRKPADPNEKSVKKSKKDIFTILSCEERACTSKTSTRPPSTFISRVSSGHVRRAAPVNGEYLVEVKVYKNADIDTVAADDRYRYALAAVKLECAADTEEWDLLQQFLAKAYKSFENSEAVYFTYKKK